MTEITKHRGRPKKAENQGQENTEKKRRGRPRKNDVKKEDGKTLELKANADKPMSLQKDGKETYTKEENKAALLAQIEEIEDAYIQGQITFKDKSAQISAIRFRLQDKFELEKSDKERRIIVVPAKHLFICKHTNRECSNMPPKEVCMKYYNLIEKDNASKK